MMNYPLLYEKSCHVENGSYTGFICRLDNVINCEVFEEIDGDYYLTIECSNDATVSRYITLDRCIVCKNMGRVESDPVRDELFRIISIESKTGGLITVTANHISRDLDDIVVKGCYYSHFSSTDVAVPLSSEFNEKMHENTINVGKENYFTFGGIGNFNEFRAETYNPTTMAQFLWKGDGSIRAESGGVMYFHGHNAYVCSGRGINRGLIIDLDKYGVSFNDKVDLDGVYTSCVAWWQASEDKNARRVKSDVQKMYDNLYDGGHTYIYDASGDFEEEPTVSQLNDIALQQLSNNLAFLKNRCLTIDSIDYLQLFAPKSVLLGDTIRVLSDRYGIDETLTVSSILYDALNDRYASITIGKPEPSLSDTISNIQQISGTASKTEILRKKLKQVAYTGNYNDLTGVCKHKTYTATGAVTASGGISWIECPDISIKNGFVLFIGAYGNVNSMALSVQRQMYRSSTPPGNKYIGITSIIDQTVTCVWLHIYNE